VFGFAHDAVQKKLKPMLRRTVARLLQAPP
jgi:hypothetical protein